MIYGTFGSSPASKIDENLWQGGFPKNPDDVRENGFDMIVLCAEELQPLNAQEAHELFPRITVVCAPMDDVDNGPNKEEIEIAVEAANQVIAALECGKKVLVTCAMGRNRSGLVTALALVGYRGMSGRYAASVVRAKRSKALTNPGFSRFLEKIPASARTP